MTFKELKKYIDESQNKSNLVFPIYYSSDDEIEVISILYDRGISCNNFSSSSDIYDVVKKYNLDSELFKKPYYLKISLQSFNENTINIINQLDDNVFVEIFINNIPGNNGLQLLSKISHAKCQFVCNGWIDLDSIYFLVNRFVLTEDSSPVIVIRNIDSTTASKITSVYQKNSNLRFRIEIKDQESLQKLDSITPYIREEEPFVVLSDDLFDEKNPKNARNAIVETSKNKNCSDKKLHINFRNIRYDNMEQIYELERYLELVKSHIPSNASELDIIIYVTLFMINYFRYDYDMYEKSKKDSSIDDINLTQFISSGKGVCRHFASFTEYLLNSLGVKCKRLDSMDNYHANNDWEGHAFNIVIINGKSYFLDNTWIVEEIQKGLVQSIVESNNLLTSNETFGHTEYKDVLDKYNCEDYPRQEIIDSINRVVNWNNNYTIHPQALKDLLRKYILKREKSIEEKIEDAIPRRK